MFYAVGVGVYIAMYILSTVLPLVFLSGGSVIRVIIFSIPVLLVGPRVGKRFAEGTPLLPDAFKNAGGFLLGGGLVLVSIGHLAFFGAIGFGVWLAMQGTDGVPVGIVAGMASFPYLLGIVLVEIAFRNWASGQPGHVRSARRLGTVTAVGVIIAGHLAFAIGDVASGRKPNLLNYHEMEAMALSRGFATQVQRITDQFYVAEGRIPCREDDYVDLDSLLDGRNGELRRMLSIELLDCGRFAVTIHRRLDGTADGQLVYSASPGDVDAGTPLEWQCVSKHHDRIERLTKGQCTYDPSVDTSVATTASARSAPVARRAGNRQPPRSAPASASMPQSHLDKFDERPLWENCSADVVTYRLLKVAEDQTAFVVRMWDDGEGMADFRSVSAPTPQQIRAKEGNMGMRTFGLIEERLASAGFWTRQTGENTAGPDGSYVYLEACKDGSYRAVQTPANDPSFAQVATIIAQAGNQYDWHNR